jgi:hypothetical protein
MQHRSLQQVRVSASLIFLIHGLIIFDWKYALDSNS